MVRSVAASLRSGKVLLAISALDTLEAVLGVLDTVSDVERAVGGVGWRGARCGEITGGKDEVTDASHEGLYIHRTCESTKQGQTLLPRVCARTTFSSQLPLSAFSVCVVLALPLVASLFLSFSNASVCWPRKWVVSHGENSSCLANCGVK